MPVTLKPVETEVEYMEDLDVGFISLVDKGANHTPFKIIKSEEVIMDEVIQSVITPTSKGFDDYKGNCAWSKEFKVAKTENHGDYTKHISFPLSDLKSETVKIVKLDEEGGVFGIVGQPQKPEDFHIVLKAALMDTPVRFSEEGIHTFGDCFYAELGNVVNSIAGTMALEKLDNKKKKLAIGNALDAFKAFISAGLDINSGQTVVAMRDVSRSSNDTSDIGSEVVNMSDVIVDEKVEKAELGTQPGMNTGVTDPNPIGVVDIQNQVIKSQEEMLKMISELAQKMESLAATVEKMSVTGATESDDELSGKGIPGPNDTSQVAIPSAVEKSEATVKMEETLDTIMSKVSKLEQIVEKIDGEVPAPVPAQDPVVKSEPKDESPFSGLFSHIKR